LPSYDTLLQIVAKVKELMSSIRKSWKSSALALGCATTVPTLLRNSSTERISGKGK